MPLLPSFCAAIAASTLCLKPMLRHPHALQTNVSLWCPCRGLEGMLAQRRKLLQYLRRADFDAYAKMLSALGLKDRYMKQVILWLAQSLVTTGPLSPAQTGTT